MAAAESAGPSGRPGLQGGLRPGPAPLARRGGLGRRRLGQSSRRWRPARRGRGSSPAWRRRGLGRRGRGLGSTGLGLGRLRRRRRRAGCGAGGAACGRRFGGPGSRSGRSALPAPVRPARRSVGGALATMVTGTTEPTFRSRVKSRRPAARPATGTCSSSEPSERRRELRAHHGVRRLLRRAPRSAGLAARGRAAGVGDQVDRGEARGGERGHHLGDDRIGRLAVGADVDRLGRGRRRPSRAGAARGWRTAIGVLLQEDRAVGADRDGQRLGLVLHRAGLGLRQLAPARRRSAAAPRS